ncbi:MAG: ATP-binding cassette domain-containing protein [Candidatus Latescibacteria bacterium]|nr:ATP-binding cassette domain-containing protein [Candidatus Latescibacterota bacterium]
MIELQGVTKRYDRTVAVDGIDYRFQPGKLTGFLGPNGAGKSTTIRMIMNIIAPDSGRITAGGEPLTEDFRNRLGYLPEERGLYKKMKVLDHLVFFGSLKGLSRGEARRRGQAWLDRLGLADRAQGKVEDLSKGMQQKIQFAGTLLHEPELILLDEPFSGLDPINAEALKDIMLELKRAGRTVIFSTHMMDQAEKLCDEIALINKGQLVLSGALSALRASFGRSNLRVRFVGDAGVLRGDARVVSFQETEPGLAELRLADGHAPGEVLREWSARLDIDHFEVIVPSLHNIFIQTVTAPAAAAEGGAA